jgi:hypothetical protein
MELFPFRGRTLVARHPLPASRSREFGRKVQNTDFQNAETSHFQKAAKTNWAEFLPPDQAQAAKTAHSA